MADEDPWVIEDPSESVPEENQTITEESGLQAPTAAEPEVPSDEDHAPPPEDDQFRKPVTLYRHWVRPKFLQYDYLYDYRKNYYDDVLNYMDKRSRGVNTEVPRAQYWAERVLRTVNSRPSYADICEKKHHERQINAFSSSIRFHNYHTRAYINRKYSSVL